MLRLPVNAFALRRLTRTWLGLGFAFLACSFTVLADTSALLRTVPVSRCYCHCSESHSRGGCVRMCESKRNASRWWAISCVKPHMRRPASDSNAGPRFPHPDRAEHVKLKQEKKVFSF
jgi:hypothetical protein